MPMHHMLTVASSDTRSWRCQAARVSYRVKWGAALTLRAAAFLCQVLPAATNEVFVLCLNPLHGQQGVICFLEACSSTGAPRTASWHVAEEYPKKSYKQHTM